MEEKIEKKEPQIEPIVEKTENELPKKKEKKNKKEKINDAEILKLKEENVLLNDKVLRINAELQNIKRRNNEEMSRLLKYDGENLIKKILPIIDNFERAINMDDENLEDEVSKFLSGFKMIYSNLKNILEEFEIKEIECLGKEFSPENMEAVLTDHIEGKEKNTVIDVLQKGYCYKDKIIRPAMVKVND
ncbi:MAG: nucleotide exchange factor GrpE [Bacilli bacterium]|nr:nucleotide exchange factor GrpE [Bacilli bacterium]